MGAIDAWLEGFMHGSEGLWVILHEGRSESEDLATELQNLVKSRLGTHEYPREVEFVRELPMTPSGKIQRKVLR